MKSNDPKIERKNLSQIGNNTFIAGTGKDWKSMAITELKKLEAEGKKVIITDPYLFAESEPEYENDLTDVLLSLKAAEIMCFSWKECDDNLIRRIQLKLSSIQCQLTNNKSMKDCHDRFWLCAETNKALVFGTSLNGLGKKISHIDLLTNDDILKLINELKRRGISCT